MLVIIATITLALLAILYTQQLYHRKRLRSAMHFDSEGLPRLRISVVVCYPQGINYIASILKSDSAAYQVIVVADFEKDEQLLAGIIHYFHLIRTDHSLNFGLPNGAVRGMFRSHKRLFSKVVVVDSPRNRAYTPFEVGASVSDYNYNLQIRSLRPLRTDAIENLVLELAIREEGSVEQISSGIGERVKLICREAAITDAAGRMEVRKDRKIRIYYRLLSY